MIEIFPKHCMEALYVTDVETSYNLVPFSIFDMTFLTSLKFYVTNLPLVRNSLNVKIANIL